MFTSQKTLQSLSFFPPCGCLLNPQTWMVLVRAHGPLARSLGSNAFYGKEISAKLGRVLRVLVWGTGRSAGSREVFFILK